MLSPRSRPALAGPGRSYPAGRWSGLPAAIAVALAAGCGGRSVSALVPDGPAPTLRADVQPVTRVEDAEKGVFIPPFIDCRSPRPGETGATQGKVCTPVAVSGCTEAGKYFPEYADCAIVRRQRPYYPKSPKRMAEATDARLDEPAYRAELAWVTGQVRSAACTCCHDAGQTPAGPATWSIDVTPNWTGSVSDAGIALFAGLADSSIFGAYPPAENNGFERTITGMPSTDANRMRAFFTAELARRGVSEAAARAFPPFGGSLVATANDAPAPCSAGEGVDSAGRVVWAADATARYLWVLDAGTANPGAPPSGDIPEGTLWRLDVLASADALVSGVPYGTTPKGSFQAYPATGRSPALKDGQSYHIFVERDVGRPVTNCRFTFRLGRPVAE